MSGLIAPNEFEAAEIMLHQIREASNRSDRELTRVYIKQMIQFLYITNRNLSGDRE